MKGSKCFYLAWIIRNISSSHSKHEDIWRIRGIDQMEEDHVSGLDSETLKSQRWIEYFYTVSEFSVSNLLCTHCLERQQHVSGSGVTCYCPTTTSLSHHERSSRIKLTLTTVEQLDRNTCICGEHSLVCDIRDRGSCSHTLLYWSLNSRGRPHCTYSTAGSSDQLCSA